MGRWSLLKHGKSFAASEAASFNKMVPNARQATGGAGSNPWDDRPSSIFLLTVWFGLVIGWGEALCGMILYGLNQCMLDLVNPYPWSIPLADAFLLAIPGLVLYVLKRFRVVSWRLGAVTLVLSAVFFGNLIFTVGEMRQEGLYWWAALLLAVGLAIQARRLVVKHPHTFYRVVSRTTPVLIGVIGVVTVVTLARDSQNHRNMVLGIPPASGNSPNVVLLVLDTVRAKSMSLYGYHRPTTPNLERWAERGVVFERAVSTAPFTLTSHASMFTGRYPDELSADWSVPLDHTYPTMAQIFYSHGYMTAGFVANISSCGVQTGLERGFVHYKAHQLNFGEVVKCNSIFRFIMPRPLINPVAAKQVNASFLEFLSSNRERPFFAFLNYIDAHSPYFAQEPVGQPDRPYMAEEKRKLLQWTLESFVNQKADGLELARGSYDACLAELDGAVDSLLKELEKREELRRTVVVIVSDHGEQFGEHGLVQHADSLYRSVLHVPLMIIDPRSPAAGQRVSDMISLRNLPATILELVGLRDQGIPGDSFASAITLQPVPQQTLPKPYFAFISRGTNFPLWHPNSTGPVKAVFLDGKYYIRSHGKEEFYDFDNDPEEQWDLTQSQVGSALLDQYRPLLLTPAAPAK